MNKISLGVCAAENSIPGNTYIQKEYIILFVNTPYLKTVYLLNQLQ